MHKVIIKNSTTKELPSAEILEKAGWTVEASDPKTTATPLADDGHTATDEPTNGKTVTDYSAPVTAAADEDAEESTEDTNEDDAVEAEEEENNVLAALRVAELESEIGLTSEWNGGDKYARIAELEGYSPERLNERIATLTIVKSAGLTRKTARVSNSLPRLAAGNTTANDMPDEAALFF